jgi:Concanavalin A-like lectin/glucanases superfamily/Peptide-N-glycosidase F, C terminal/Secretion system C-terminal sorting domain
MKSFRFLLFLGFFVTSTLSAQDSLKVQTFTHSNAARSGVFDFPNTPGETYRKIWMRYNMRCHGGVAGGCREWDYSCNTFVIDSTRVDSARAVSPEHVVSGFAANGFQYSSTPTPYGQSFLLYQTDLVGLNPNQVAFGADQGTVVTSAAPTFKYQAILSKDLMPGLVAGELKGMLLSCATDPGALKYLRIRMQNTSLASLNPAQPVEAGWRDVYFNHISKTDASTSLSLPFYQSFNWDGTSNILLEVSYTLDTGATPVKLLWQDLPAESAIQTQLAADQALWFHARGTMQVPATKMNQISNEISVMFWAYGLPESLPSTTSIMEGVDAQNRRQLNIHLPWDNSNVYWDCGNDGNNYDRINKLANVADLEGKWNHWVFTKEAAGNLKIYLNGVLWHSGTGMTRPIDIEKFVIGSNINQSATYKGGLNELSIWKRALTLAEVQSMQYKYLDPTSGIFADVLYYYSFDEQVSNPNIAQDHSNNPANASLSLPARRLVRGDGRHVDFRATTQFPVCKFWQGLINITTNPVSYLDTSQVQQPVSITQYGVVANVLTPFDTTLVYPAGTIYAYNPVGVLADSFQVNSAQTLQSGLLTHYTFRPAKYELLSLVTPYGNGLSLGAAGKTFMFDVTDFGPILKGKKRISMEYGGENQEEIDLQFIYVKGTPERPVLDMQQIWPLSRGGFDGIQSDAVFEPRTIQLRADAGAFKLRSAVTGHEQNGEFTPREHYLNVNGGNQEFKYDVWKACGKNPIYPQGGTWVFDRAGWCPGMATDVHEFALNGLVQPGTTATFDYGVNGPSLSAANYLVNNQLVSYGSFTYPLDASVEQILRPNGERVEFERINPICSYPIVEVRNSGSTPITSMEITYRIVGGYSRTENWTGTIQPAQNAEITLQSATPAFWSTGNGVFEVEITKVNNQVDQNSANNTAKTSFKQAKVFDYTQPMRLRLQTNNVATDNSYRIKDADGAIVLTRSGLTNNTVYTDAIDFAPGCYTIEFDDTGNDGLNFWFYPNNGSGSLSFQRNVSGTAWAPIHSFNADFGAGVQFDFVVGGIVDAPEAFRTHRISLFPNPASDLLHCELTGFDATSVSTRLVDLTGQIMYQNVLKTSGLDTESLEIPVAHLPVGMYILHLFDGRKNYQEAVMVLR